MWVKKVRFIYSLAFVTEDLELELIKEQIPDVFDNH